MPDIQMCSDEDCPFRTRCYRHPDSGTKPSEYWQAWGYFEKVGPPTKPENCKGWWDKDKK